MHTCVSGGLALRPAPAGGVRAAAHRVPCDEAMAALDRSEHTQQPAFAAGNRGNVLRIDPEMEAQSFE